MPSNEPNYCVWGADQIAYGPFSRAALAAWAGTHRLAAGCWVFSDQDGSWKKIEERTELKDLARGSAGEKGSAARKRAVGLLRELNILPGLSDAQLESFAQYADTVEVSQFTQIVKKGDPGDAMFVVLEGEVRAYVIVDGRECTLSSIGPGEFIGEISLLDQGPRSADLAVNVDTTLLKISARQLKALYQEAPALAAAFLLALSRTAVGRIRNMTQKYSDSVQFMGKNIAGWA